MLVRYVLLIILIAIVARAFWRVVDGIVEGIGGRRQPRVPEHGVHMVRDPVCGTFVVPERALTLLDNRQRLFFCSPACRDKYRARSA
jgi:YHS domain-containing protein